MAIAEDVRQAVAAGFAEADRPAVFAALKRYRWRRDTARVQRAVLVLSGGEVREVERLMDAANEDYRDLLYWAESPEESGVGTEAEMAGRYRRLGLRVPFAQGTPDAEQGAAADGGGT